MRGPTSLKMLMCRHGSARGGFGSGLAAERGGRFFARFEEGRYSAPFVPTVHPFVQNAKILSDRIAWVFGSDLLDVWDMS